MLCGPKQMHDNLFFLQFIKHKPKDLQWKDDCKGLQSSCSVWQHSLLKIFILSIAIFSFLLFLSFLSFLLFLLILPAICPLFFHIHGISLLHLQKNSPFLIPWTLLPFLLCIWSVNQLIYTNGPGFNSQSRHHMCIYLVSSSFLPQVFSGSSSFPICI